MENELIIFQSENGALELRINGEKDTVWASLDQIATLFGRDKSVISRHINNIFKEEELQKDVVVAFFATTTQHGAIKNKTQTKQVAYYNLDMLLSVGYRVNSKIATKFRQWATKLLNQHITKGYTINEEFLKRNKAQFIKTLEDLKILTKENSQLKATDVLTLIESFSGTFFALDSYDRNNFPTQGTKKEIETSAKDLSKDLQKLKQELINKGEATVLFAQEKKKGNLEGIFGNVFQTVFGEDAYPTIEEKAAHLLYFVVKNHPFNDGNKRSGAFSFIWFLQKAEYPFHNKISPETLTVITILIAESNPADKEKMIGIVKSILNF
ncbi:virulence protein RhuM/Fic/DOC family protein [Paenimyroides aestuarii]|uniref:Type II toxin-antitoxin system death-on-curing family toxin n=1 Tax=Paenimyroides aestuarii TaxID=2968490 RepID=A0ABY5NRX7_9FLAO|nr:virulence protein RhuM/Fic/DOC family protein [Paenimyroides aestuarii]UUV21335.1 type II toxin-antitoxin system death-on-curing family toxin [Paenimyroides aestuarii]